MQPPLGSGSVLKAGQGALSPGCACLAVDRAESEVGRDHL